MAEKILTQAVLKARLHYNPITGFFTWKIHTAAGKVWPGKVAGSNTNAGYIETSVAGHRCLAHRLAFLYMLGHWPRHQVDHINRIRTDNRWCNLRDVEARYNQRNMKVDHRNTSGTTGVSRSPNGGWDAAIGRPPNRQRKYFAFENFHEAVQWRKDRELEMGYHPK